METKDPALTKTRIVDNNTHSSERDHLNPHYIGGHDEHKGTETFQETVIGTRYPSDDIHHDHETHHHNHGTVYSDVIGDTNHKGTETLQETVVGNEHVHEGDNIDLQPDRRDQKGNPFDEGINEHSTSSGREQSDVINDMNRYANIDNAQSRVLTPDEKD